MAARVERAVNHPSYGAACLMALRRCEDSDEAFTGAMFEARFMGSVIQLVDSFRKK